MALSLPLPLKTAGTPRPRSPTPPHHRHRLTTTATAAVAAVAAVVVAALARPTVAHSFLTYPPPISNDKVCRVGGPPYFSKNWYAWGGGQVEFGGQKVREEAWGGPE